MKNGKRTLISLALICTFVLSACYKSQQPEVAREWSPHLTQSYAEFRSQQIDQLRYHFAVDITHREYFSGVADITFSLADGNNSDVTLDFNKGTIESLFINGAEAPFQYEKWFITLSQQSLKPGENKVRIAYRRPYNTDGQGLHQYRDAQTGNHYLYTQFEAYSGNHFAPMFDQPDMKAVFSMDVTAPETWAVITATRENHTAALDDKRKLWQFPPTKVIPTYIYSLHAGPFRVWEDQYQDIPLRLFAREELAEYVDINEWMPTTKASFRYLQGFFDFPYPFEKYDQVLVPDFNFGAMENVGAVTFGEFFLSRGEKTEQEKYRLAEVIAHEMAHMWFGNIVTMRWWDDLWLNESFATYMAFDTIASMPEFQQAWTHFSRLKGWAYYEDQLVTTHPIAVPIRDTSEVFSIFDGISYAKGASVLKQLAHFVGEDAFQQSMAHYVSKHQYDNTRLSDFAAAIAEVSGKNMDRWVDEWLLAPGLNTIEVEFQCEANQLAGITLLQSAPEAWPTLRSQRVQLALFNKTPGDVQLSETLDVTYSGAKTQLDLSSLPAVACPDFVYPNYEDWGYLKPRFSDDDIAFLDNNIGYFDNATLRLALWRSMWSLVHDVEIPLTQYIAFVDSNIAGESDTAILSHLLMHQLVAFDLVGVMALPESEQIQKNIESMQWRELKNSAPGTSRQKDFFKSAVATSFSRDKLTRLAAYLDGDETPAGLNLDQDMRWSMVVQLNRFAYPGAKTRIEQELQRDSSERARLHALAAEIVRPELAVKQQWLDRILDSQSELKLADLRMAMENVFPGEQQQMRYEFAQHIVEHLPKLLSTKDDMYFRVFGDHMLPANCTEKSEALLNDLLSQAQDYSNQLVKKLKIAHQNDARCRRQKALIMQAGN